MDNEIQQLARLVDVLHQDFSEEVDLYDSFTFITGAFWGQPNADRVVWLRGPYLIYESKRTENLAGIDVWVVIEQSAADAVSMRVFILAE